MNIVVECTMAYILDCHTVSGARCDHRLALIPYQILILDFVLEYQYSTTKSQRIFTAFQISRVNLKHKGAE